MENDGSLGAKFWFGFMGMILGGVIAAALLFIIFGAAWYAWGFFGVLAFMTVVGLGFGYASDRREKKRRAPHSGAPCRTRVTNPWTCAGLRMSSFGAAVTMLNQRTLPVWRSTSVA